jgi:hypothetical protein
MNLLPAPRSSGERGAIAITAAFFALALCGVALALLSEVDASKKMFDRGEAGVRALEAAETGVVHAEQEISSLKDGGADGIGNVTGSFGGAAFTVTATQDPVVSSEWIVQARGRRDRSARSIEVRVRRVPTSAWSFALFAATSVTIGAGAVTDSYDSRDGSYASQATKTDSFGSFAGNAASIGADGAIAISNGRVRGDSDAGPGYATTISGSGSVTGSSAPMKKVIAVPDTPLPTFVSAASVNNNGSWSTTGGTTYNSVTKSLTVTGGNTLTLTGTTYFFTRLVLSGGSTLKVTAGPVRIYVTDKIDLGGGSILNTTERPDNLRLYQQPYALPVGYVPTINTATLSGAAKAAFTYYGPKTPVTIAGSGDLFGSIVGKSVVPTGASKIHYDVALQEEMGGVASIRRVYWRDLAPPPR